MMPSLIIATREIPHYIEDTRSQVNFLVETGLNLESIQSNLEHEIMLGQVCGLPAYTNVVNFKDNFGQPIYVHTSIYSTRKMHA